MLTCYILPCWRALWVSGIMAGVCGRFAVITSTALLAEKIKAVDEATVDAPNYNVAPTVPIATVVSRHSESDYEPTRRVRLMRWGLIPPWIKASSDGGPDIKGPLLINVRADKVATSPVFRNSAKSKRCLVPMDGWYEWQVNVDSALGKKASTTPFFINRDDGATLFMAGLWSVWQPANSSAMLLSCTIITTDAVGELAEIHDRMPLILAEYDWDVWLNPYIPLDPQLLARSPDVHDIDVRPVSTLVNSVRNNGPELLEPVLLQPGQITLL